MFRMLAMPLAAAAVVTGTAGCATRAPASPAGGGPAASADGSPASAASAAPSVSYSSFATAVRAGGRNPEATIPNPGTGAGDPLLARALLPQFAPRRTAAFPLPPAAVALPDRDPRSLFIGLRQYASPVRGPRACEEWTVGLSTVAVSDFNRPGVQLGIELSLQPPAGQPMFSEAIVTGPSSVLAALANPPLPTACRDIATPPDPGGVKPGAAPAPGSGALSARAFEITGTGKFPVWAWAEVIQGKGFVLEIRIPNQSGDPDPGTALPAIAANAYRRAASVLAPPRP